MDGPGKRHGRTPLLRRRPGWHPYGWHGRAGGGDAVSHQADHSDQTWSLTLRCVIAFGGQQPTDGQGVTPDKELMKVALPSVPQPANRTVITHELQQPRKSDFRTRIAEGFLHIARAIHQPRTIDTDIPTTQHARIFHSAAQSLRIPTNLAAAVSALFRSNSERTDR